ncbi:MAG: DegT/DnrJ/EryC1/StrS family aminotransferase [Syntrophales bacterium]|nr:DegT/DnrJ/EryC1/StrS family aminotransferase [Syntrophales bacterium]
MDRGSEKRYYVTKPTLPPLDKFTRLLEDIWNTKILTNNGKYHQDLERQLCKYLGVSHCSLFANGTLALTVALQALRITGEVITTPFSFVATAHALYWNGITPVFCDIDEETLNVDAQRIESLITPKTTAILPVHVYGHPCDVESIAHISDIYGLKVIYDAAHAFGVKKNGESILRHGDLSVLSFHATKVFNTAEGGAIIALDEKLKQRIDFLKNFGFADEVTVVAPGINAKMNEIQAALGLLQLIDFNDGNERRKKVANCYTSLLERAEGIRVFSEGESVEHNYSYYPILIDSNKLGMSRDALYERLKEFNIFTRRYFYPLISSFPAYRGLPSAAFDNLPVANRIANQVLCLPIYSDLEVSDVEFIVDTIFKIVGV